jgi:hypothetical protein
VVIAIVGSLSNAAPQRRTRTSVGASHLQSCSSKTAFKRRDLEETPMLDQRPCEEFRSWRELMDDPLTRLVMRADGIQPERMRAFLKGVADRQRPFRQDPSFSLPLAA